jgi:hypothetical protein
MRVRVSEVTAPFAETKVEENCELSNKSKAPKIAPALLPNHVTFPANANF